MVVKINIMSINKRYSKLKVKCFKTPNASYTHRYLQGKERETVEHKLRILRREFKHIIDKLTDWKDFVFADPLLPFGSIREALTHCTHLQITLAYPQTKICKRVQSTFLNTH